MTTRNQLLRFSSFAALAADDAAAQGQPAATQVKTVGDDMDSRRIFATVDDAIAYLTQCAETFSDFDSIPLAGAGLDAEGNFDESIYDDSMSVMVATLRKTAGNKGTKAIVVAPVPKLDSLLGDEAGKLWVQRIIDKELNHVAVRPLREAEDISTVVDQMPTTRAAYISSARESSGILETFNEVYKNINATLSKRVPAWARAKLLKSDLKKCLESKGFAEEYYPTLEDWSKEHKSLFVIAAGLGITGAKAQGLDPTIFERWLATRDQKKFSVGADPTESEDFDADSFTESLMADIAKAPADEAKPATEGDAAQA